MGASVSLKAEKLCRRLSVLLGSRLVFDSEGNLYVTTLQCGSSYGSIFELLPSPSGWTIGLSAAQRLWIRQKRPGKHEPMKRPCLPSLRFSDYSP